MSPLKKKKGFDTFHQPSPAITPPIQASLTNLVDTMMSVYKN